MKHIKRIDELNINTYRSAAQGLRSFNKDKRANDLDDWADKKDFGYYNAMFANSGTIIDKSAVFTKPRLIGIYTSNSDKNIIKDESGVEDMVSDWSENICELSLKFEFGFKATGNTSTKHTHLKLQSVPLFSIKLVLCGYIDQYSGYDDDCNIRDVYNEIGIEEFFLLRPNDDMYFGILSDRVSAFRFIKFLKTIINGDIKDKIMDVLNIIGGNTSDLNRILESFNGIRTHGLYSDYSTSSKKWYDLRIN